MNSTRALDLTSPLTKSHLMQKLCAVQEIHAKDEEDAGGTGVVEGVPTEEGEAYARFIVGYHSHRSSSEVSSRGDASRQAVSENISPPMHQAMVEEEKQ